MGRNCKGKYVPVPGVPGVLAVVKFSDNWRDEPRPKYRYCSGCDRFLLFDSTHWPAERDRPFGLGYECRKCNNHKCLPRNLAALKRLRLDILTRYGRDNKPVCNCCGESKLEFLTLDHTNGGGNAERKTCPAPKLHRRLRREGFPPGYRTLCWNCNASLGLYGYCPHQNAS